MTKGLLTNTYARSLNINLRNLAAAGGGFSLILLPRDMFQFNWSPLQPQINQNLLVKQFQNKESALDTVSPAYQKHHFQSFYLTCHMVVEKQSLHR